MHQQHWQWRSSLLQLQLFPLNTSSFNFNKTLFFPLPAFSTFHRTTPNRSHSSVAKANIIASKHSPTNKTSSVNKEELEEREEDLYLDDADDNDLSFVSLSNTKIMIYTCIHVSSGGPTTNPKCALPFLHFLKFIKFVNKILYFYFILFIFI